MKNHIKNYIKIMGLAAVPFGTVQAEDIITIRVAKEDITEGGGSRFVISKENGKGECLKSASILWRNDCLRSVLENTGGWLKAGILNSSHGGMLEGIDGYILREGLPFVASYCFYIGSDGFYFALVRTINKQKHMLVIFSPAEGLCVFSDIPTKSFGCSAVYTDNEWVESKLSFRRWGVHITIRIPWVIPVIISGVLFGAYHMHVLNVLEFVSCFSHVMSGVVLAIIMVRKRNVIITSGIHIIFNLYALLTYAFMLSR